LVAGLQLAFRRDVVKRALDYAVIVPYCVSTLSSIAAIRAVQTTRDDEH
jgi:hypothetical protein